MVNKYGSGKAEVKITYSKSTEYYVKLTFFGLYSRYSCRRVEIELAITKINTFSNGTTVQ